MPCPQGQGDPPHDILHAGDGNAVAQRFVAGGVGGSRQVRPKIWKPLEALAFQRSQPANEQRHVHHQLVLPHILTVGPFAVTAGQRPNRFLICWLTDQICGILLLAGALGGCNIAAFEYIHLLSGVGGMAVNGIAGGVSGPRLLQDQTEVVAASTRPGW